MNAKSNLAKIKSVIEIIGLTAVVISLLLVWKETEQNRILAEAQFDLMIAQNSLLTNQIITDHPNVWYRGCRKDSLSADEKVVFKAMVENKNDVILYRVIKSLRLNEDLTSHSDWADFVGFLHQNPGAREVWEKREESLMAYRQALGALGTNTWYRNIQAALASLDQRVEN